MHERICAMSNIKLNYYWLPLDLIDLLEKHAKAKNIEFKFISSWDDESLSKVDEKDMHRFLGLNGEYDGTGKYYEGIDELVGVPYTEKELYPILKTLSEEANSIQTA